MILILQSPSVTKTRAQLGTDCRNPTQLYSSHFVQLQPYIKNLISICFYQTNGSTQTNQFSSMFYWVSYWRLEICGIASPSIIPQYSQDSGSPISDHIRAKTWSRLIVLTHSQVSWIYSDGNIIHMSIYKVITQYTHCNQIQLKNVVKYHLLPLTQVNDGDPTGSFSMFAQVPSILDKYSGQILNNFDHSRIHSRLCYILNVTTHNYNARLIVFLCTVVYHTSLSFIHDCLSRQALFKTHGY